MTNNTELTAYCGLFCGDCIRYKSRTSELASELLSELSKTDFDEYAKLKSSPNKQPDPETRFGYYRECCEMLKALVDLQCDTPCRTGNGCSSFDCEILKCCREKELYGCWECGIFDKCDKLYVLEAIHRDYPRKNLKTIKNLGIDAWVKTRSKSYIWQLD